MKKFDATERHVMSSLRAEVHQRIEAVFAAAPYPGDDNIVVNRVALVIGF